MGPQGVHGPQLKTACLDRRWGPPSILFSENDIDHSRPFSVEVKNEWRYTSNAPICRHGVDGGNSKLNSVALVRERTIPTERPPPVGEVSANFCG